MSVYVCPGCGYAYDEATGDPREGWPAGTPFVDIDPDWPCPDWPCPDCAVREAQDFEPRDNTPQPAHPAQAPGAHR